MEGEPDFGDREGVLSGQEQPSLCVPLDALPVPSIYAVGERSDSAAILGANAASVEVLGETVAPGTPLSALFRRYSVFYPDRQSRIPWTRLPVVRALDGGEDVRREEIHLLRPDAQWRVLLVNAAPVRTDGRITGVVVMFQDVTERREAARRLAAQYAVSQVLSEAADLSEAATEILGAIGVELGWGYGALWVLGDGEEVLRCAGTWHASGLEFVGFEAATRQATLSPGKGLPGRVWVSGEPAWIADVSHDANFPRRLAAVLEGMSSGFGFPVVLDGKVLGVFEFFSREVRQPDPELVHTMASLGGQIGQFIERRRAEIELREARQRVEDAYQRERRIAVQFQADLLPRKELQVPGYAVAAVYRPALREADVGGDFYNILQIDEHRVGIIIGDIGGKGLAAAVIAAWMQHAVVALMVGERAFPDTVVRGIRRAIPLFGEPERLATVFVGILEHETGRLTYTSAGHEPAMIWRTAARQIVVLEPNSPAIVSVSMAIEDRTLETTFDPGDLLFLYTDGLPDARPGRGSQPLGLECVQELLLEHHSAAPADIIRVMCNAAERHAHGRLPDDLALLAVRRLGDEADSAFPSRVSVEHDGGLTTCDTAMPSCSHQSLP